MGMKKVVIAAMQEYLLPELDDLKSGQSALRSELVHVNKRLDDVNLHLVDQSRRIDAVREELNQNIAATNAHLDGTNKRLDKLFEIVVRREEHFLIANRVHEMDQEIREIKQRLAA